MPTGLIRRGARYHIRRRIPVDLVEHYGRQEITRALGTSDPKEARKLLPQVWAALDAEFDTALASLAKSGSPEIKQPTPVDPGMKAARILTALRLRRDKAAAEGGLAGFKQHLEDQLFVHQAVLNGEEEPSWSLAEHEGIRNGLRAMLTGEGAMALPTAPAAVQADDSENPSLAAVHELWVKHQERPPSTLRAMRLAVARFEEVMGPRTIKSVTRRDVTAFIDKMREPGAVTKAGFSIPNMNAMLSMLSALFGYAVRRNLIEANPATNTQIANPVRPRERRREFDPAALKAIFESPVYSEGARPYQGAGEAAYWVPLLALYTGARINELCQLHPDNVVSEAYVDPKGKSAAAWVIRIEQNKERGQRVKTGGSERRVPVHADLIKLGFITYAKAQAGQPLLFPELRAGNSEGRISGGWGQWFARYLRTACNVADERMTFHSFRHTFKHLARQALIPADVHNALTGHETGAAADAYGGVSYPLHPLVEGMKAYRVPGFKLPAPPPGI